jgi:predicted RNase H-like HicB family nuclease
MSGWTAVYVETANGGVTGYVEEMPGAHAQGATVEEVRPRLRVALEVMLAANRRTTWEDFKSARVVKREATSYPNG